MYSSTIFKIRPIEPKILPLVNELNKTGILETISSCQGHFKGTDQKIDDRNFADVRFLKLSEVPEKRIEVLLNFIFNEFHQLDNPIHLDAYKKYTGSEPRYVVMLKPKDRFDHPSQKRKDVDAAILIATKMVADAIERKIF